MKILLLALMVVGLVAWSSAAASSDVVKVATFTAGLPEGLAVGSNGDLYVGLLSGEIRKVTPDGEVSSLVTLDPDQGFLLGLAFNQQDLLYAALASANPDTHGIWEVQEDGTAQRFAALDEQGLPNAIVVDRSGNLLVSDSFLGRIWKITPDGEVSVWAEDDLLLGTAEESPIGLAVGANGMAFGEDDALYVANSDFGRLVRVRVNPDGSAGSVKAVLEDEGLKGADGIAFDQKDNIYLAVNQHDKLVKITPDQEIKTLATDWLAYPASIAFGVGEERESLYITNLALLRAQGLVEGTPNPNLVRLDVDVAGRPLP
jgi:sugar lactone lactonase YvrE